MSETPAVTHKHIVARANEKGIDFFDAMDELLIEEHSDCKTVCSNPTLTALSFFGSPAGLDVSFPPNKYCQRARQQARAKAGRANRRTSQTT